ncbi:MAG: histidinol-phosphate transaminase [Mariprofundaceae bacterium]|nr:histidinol-phosphate transaminase [Mariprofundaceae bacterium]
MDWQSRAVAQVKTLHPYVPGKAIELLMAEKGLSEVIKLASNENPFGPSPKAVQAVQQAALNMHRYPDGDAIALRQALAEQHQGAIENILLGNGSNEALELLIRCFAGVDDEVIYASRGFIVYALATKAAGATGVAVEEQDGLTHDLQGMLDAINAQTKVICIANPNNPTGTLLSRADLQVFLDQVPENIIVILDEAYYEFIAQHVDDHQTLIHAGLVICRTFSKAYGLAGLRVGYAVADAAIIALVNRFREPFNVNLLAQKGALAALDDQAWMKEKVEMTLFEREKMECFLEEVELLTGCSYGNFVLLSHAQAADIATGLENRGVIPRPLAPYGMAETLRISVGSEAENNQFIHALISVMRELDA